MKPSHRSSAPRPRGPYTEGPSRRLLGFGAFAEDRSEDVVLSVPPHAPSATGRRGTSGGQRGLEEEGVYIISVAARILEMHPQTLRKYERVGLVRPSRTVGMLRLYSGEDITRLRLIKHLVGNLGLNLAGVQMALEVFNHLLGVRVRLNAVEGRELKGFLAESLDEMLALLGSRPADHSHDTKDQTYG